MEETWKDIKGYEGLYKVSTFGSVIGLKQGNILKNNINITKDGYKNLFVNLSKNGVTKTFSVKKLVFNTFIGINKRVIKNINGNEKDCRLVNLSDTNIVDRKESIKIIDSNSGVTYESASLLAKELNTTSSVLLYRIRNNKDYSRYKII